MTKTVDFVMDEVLGILTLANEKLKKMTEGGFPYTFEEVKMTADTDSAGIYIRSGMTPVVAVARAGNPEGVVNEIKARVWEEVDCTRTAIERRASLKKEVEELKDASEKQEKARVALEAIGLPTDMLNGGVNAEAAKAVVDAARKAVEKANHGLLLHFGSVCSSLGGVANMKMKVVGFAGGLVITAGGKPCMITRYPKISNAKGVERMLKFIEADVKALNASRREYFTYLREKMDQEERLHELASRMDSLNDELVAMAM